MVADEVMLICWRLTVLLNVVSISTSNFGLFHTMTCSIILDASIEFMQQFWETPGLFLELSFFKTQVSHPKHCIGLIKVFYILILDFLWRRAEDMRYQQIHIVCYNYFVRYSVFSVQFELNSRYLKFFAASISSSILKFVVHSCSWLYQSLCLLFVYT